MQIFIMRHGQASFQAESDAQRKLTEQGKLEAELMGRWMEKMSIKPEKIWVSPYVRAQQTANAVVEQLSSTSQLVTQSFITPSGNATDVRDIIDGELTVEPVEQLLLVSHMPFVSYIVSELTQQEHSPIFQTAGVVEINYNKDAMVGEFVRMVAPIDLC
ncbi:phosphohistidine phosphatase SixA [Thalassotalea euphylliae]|uniref:phosphohistidine phosphatase SixA n=1 Tax=Thalassotalea euphylliae TaxID=1655234 RepID=UPI00362E18DD